MWEKLNLLEPYQVASIVIIILTIIAIKIGLKSCNWNFKKFLRNLIP